MTRQVNSHSRTRRTKAMTQSCHCHYPSRSALTHSFVIQVTEPYRTKSAMIFISTNEHDHDHRFSSPSFRASDSHTQRGQLLIAIALTRQVSGHLDSVWKIRLRFSRQRQIGRQPGRLHCEPVQVGVLRVAIDGSMPTFADLPDDTIDLIGIVGSSVIERTKTLAAATRLDRMEPVGQTSKMSVLDSLFRSSF